MNLPKAWDAKLGAGSFFAFKKPIQEVCLQIVSILQFHGGNFSNNYDRELT